MTRRRPECQNLNHKFYTNCEIRLCKHIGVECFSCPRDRANSQNSRNNRFFVGCFSFAQHCISAEKFRLIIIENQTIIFVYCELASTHCTYEKQLQHSPLLYFERNLS